MEEFHATCPPCGQEIRAASEDALITAMQEHARNEHGHEVSADDVRAALAPHAGA